MLSLFLILSAATLAHLGLAALILRRTAPSTPGRRFAYVAVSVGVWVACTVVIVAPWSSREVVLWASRASFAGATLLGVTWLWFCLGFPQPSVRFRVPTLATMAMGALPMLCWPTPLFMRDIGDAPYWAHAQRGDGFGLFGLWIGAALALGIWHLHHKSRSLRGTDRYQVRYVYLGFAGLTVGAFSSIIIATLVTNDSRFAPLGVLSSLLMTGTITYAIVRHRLLDIRLVITSGMAFAITVTLASLALAATVALARAAWPHGSTARTSWISFSAAVALVLAAEPLRRTVRQWLARRFHKRAVDDGTLLRRAGLAMAAARDQATLLARMVEALDEAVHPTCTAIYLVENGAGRLLHAAGVPADMPAVLPAGDSAIAQACGGQVIVRDSGPTSAPLAPSTCPCGEALLPLIVGDELVGLIVLGEQRSGDPYTTNDVALLGTLATYIALALDNARHYHRLKTLNDELETRVAARTEQLALANAAVERERATLTAALEVLPLPIVLYDATGRAIHGNRSVHQFFGAELSERPAFELLDPLTHTPISDEQRPRTRALRGDVVAGEEFLVRMPDGREIPILGYAGPLVVGGAQTGIVVAFQDVSALKEIDRAKDDFLASLGHELKTPLTCILAWTELARDVRPDMTAKALEVIEANAQRQRRLLDDLLDLSRVIHNKLFLQPERDDLWNIVLQAIDGHQQLLADRGIAVIVEPPTESLPVMVDASRLWQAVSNLLANAGKFTDAGGVVRVRGFRRDGHATVAVSDTGCGITATDLPSVFARFRLARPSTPRSGLGIGLALVKGIVEHHGGHVAAESPGLGQGSTFTLAVPLAEEE